VEHGGEHAEGEDYAHEADDQQLLPPSPVSFRFVRSKKMASFLRSKKWREEKKRRHANGIPKSQSRCQNTCIKIKKREKIHQMIKKIKVSNIRVLFSRS
jgi:hypothetical protein